MFKWSPRMSVHCVVIYADCLALKKKTKGSSESANEGYIKMENSSEWTYSPSIGAVKENYL
jgi:hypothetical protein